LTAASTITESAAVATVSVEQFQTLPDKGQDDSILLILQSMQKTSNQPSYSSPMDIAATKKHGQQDTSSLVEQPDSKQLDSKATPNKSHPVADAGMTQSP
jgi:hypothetical protein